MSGSPPPAYRRTESEKTSSLDLTQRLERKLAQYNASQNLFKRWLFEIASVATSAICMGAIVAILILIQNKPLQNWPFGLTAITVLSKIASAALILPISEAIGQLKWSWFYGKQSRDAFDFEIFDKASRGAWGSFLLLVRTKGRSLAALGALLTVLLLAIDTFFQQVTDLPERWALHEQSGESFVARTVRYDPFFERQYQSDSGDTPMTLPNRDMVSAVSPYFYDRNGTQSSKFHNGSEGDFPVSCPTSKCEWEPYETLGVCSACADISEHLMYACLPMTLDWLRDVTGIGTEKTWPNGTACGYFINATSSQPVLMSGYRTDNLTNSTYGETLLMRILPFIKSYTKEQLNGGSINFKQINSPIMDFLIVSSADGTPQSVYEKQKPVAQECVLAWCVKRIRSSYSWGVYVEEVLNEFFNTSRTPYPWTAINHPDQGWIDISYQGNYSIFPPGSEKQGQGYGVSNSTFFNTVTTLDEIFPSLITAQSPNSEPFMKVKLANQKRVNYRSFRFSPWLAPNNVTQHIQRLATAMTDAVRADSHSNVLATGKAFAPETYVAVQWAWMTFPLTMLMLSILFLVATMIKTSHGGDENMTAWKTSAMPTLIYGLPQEMRPNLVASALSRTNEGQVVEKVKIRLQPNQGWRVSGHLCTSPTLISRSQRSAPPGWI